MEEAPQKQNRIWNRRPACIAALSMAAGVLLCRALPDGVRLPALLLLAAGALLCAFFRRRLLIVLLFLTLGVCRAGLALPDAVAPGSYTLCGRIAETPEKAEQGTLLILEDGSFSGAAVRGRVRLYVTDDGGYAYGQLVTAEARVYAAARSSFYDAARVACAAYADTARVYDGSGGNGLYGRVLALRTRAYTALDGLFGAYGGYARAILLGDTGGMDEAALNACRMQGVAHIFAVSGLHVSILAAALTPLLRLLPGKWRIAGLFFFLLGYAALTAFSPSVLRAGVMLLLGSCAFLRRRRPDGLNLLGAALVTVLFIEPLSLLSAGLALSFSAAYGLALFMPPLAARWYGRFGKGTGMFAALLIAPLAVTPAMLAYFGEVPLLAPLSNLFLLPLLPFFMVPAFACLLLNGAFSAAAAALAKFPLLVLRAMDWIVQNAAAVKLVLPPLSGVSFLLLLLMLLLLSRCTMRPLKRRLLCAGGVLISALSLWRI